MSDVMIRNYKTSDYQAVKTILEESKLFDDTWDTEERLKKRIKEKSDSIVVASINDQVVGNIYIVDDILPFIFRLAVKIEYRKQGIGKKLVEQAVKIMKKHGHAEIALLVDDDNKELQGWYRKQGFKATQKVWRGMWKAL